ncbi:MAG: GTPase Era [Candidatus Omnitrophota bacterium]
MNKVKLRCGRATIVGRPNTGKSTLLNAILGEKISIVSDVPQTTRYQIKGIFTDKRGQVVFIDTPGIHLGHERFGTLMARHIGEALGSCDVIIYLIDTNDAPGREESFLMERLKGVKVPVILGLNKIDLKATFLDTYIKLWEQVKGRSVGEMTDSLVLMPLSGLQGTNVTELTEAIFKLIPFGDLLYPEDIVSDFPQRLALADIIREKLFNVMRQEIPHFLAVYVDEIEPRSNKLTFIRAVILVERDSQKRIVIGRDGRVLKEIGQLARQEIEGILGKKVFLETQVKVKAGWRENPDILHQLGHL